MTETYEYPVGAAGPIVLGIPNPETQVVPAYWQGEGIERQLIGEAWIEYDTADATLLHVEVDDGAAVLIDAGLAEGPALATSGGGLLYGLLTNWQPAAVTYTSRRVSCAVNRSGWSDLPIGPDTTWDSAAADQRIARACGVDRDDDEDEAPDWQCYASAHLWRRDGVDPRTKGAYGMLLVDVVDGERRIMPGAVHAAAAALGGARGGLNAPLEQQQDMRNVLSAIYRRLDQVAPWDRE
jgi:hypothetical protein